MAAIVRELLNQSTQAVRRRDVAAVAELYHPNAALHMPGADLVVGRAAIAELFTRLLAEQPADLEHEVTEEHLHEVTPDLAIVDTVGTSRWGSDESGVEGFTMIAVRDTSGEWLWAGIRGALLPSYTRAPSRRASASDATWGPDAGRDAASWSLQSATPAGHVARQAWPQTGSAAA